MTELKKGIYRHYKGREYRVINEALNTENQEEAVVYQDINDEKKFWVRPKKMFTSQVTVNEKEEPRFEFQREEKVDAWEDQYKRALADYQNLLKQTAKDREEFVKYAVGDFLQDILPVYDHLKLSVNGLSEEEGKSPWAIGVQHVLKQFKDILEARGIEEIKTVGEKFDHNLMEAVDGTGETVEKEIMPGYKLNGRVIKPARVIVN
jgi:molecular chaperone GrpE